MDFAELFELGLLGTRTLNADCNVDTMARNHEVEFGPSVTMATEMVRICQYYNELNVKPKNFGKVK